MFRTVCSVQVSPRFGNMMLRWPTPWKKASSFWLMNGNYFRCKNIELGYTLPKQWVNSIGVDRCRVYVSGTNLFVFDHIGIYDPENSGDRGAYQYPLTKSFNFGINVSF